MSEIDDNYAVRALIDAVANIEAKTKKGLTPLHCAVIYRNHGAVIILIQAGADINSKTCLKRTALHFVIINHQEDQRKRSLPLKGTGPDEDIINTLLEQQNVNLDQKDVRGETRLMWAVMEKDAVIVNALLYYGANPNARNKDSATPLHIALSAQDPNLEIVLLLMKYKASLYCVDKEGNTPLDILNDYVRNTQSYEFGQTCMEFIALHYKFNKVIKPGLEINFRLFAHLAKCFGESEKMRNDVLINRFTVFDFIMYGMDKRYISVNSVFNVYTPVVLRLLAGLYPTYGFMAIKRMSKSHLCSIFEVIASSKDCKPVSDDKDLTDTKETTDTWTADWMHNAEEFNQIPDSKECDEIPGAKECNEIPGAKECNEMPGAKKCARASIDISKIDIFMLSRYLSKLDVFCLIVAFSEGKISDCMQDIRNHYCN